MFRWSEPLNWKIQFQIPSECRFFCCCFVLFNQIKAHNAINTISRLHRMQSARLCNHFSLTRPNNLAITWRFESPRTKCNVACLLFLPFQLYRRTSMTQLFHFIYYYRKCYGVFLSRVDVIRNARYIVYAGGRQLKNVCFSLFCDVYLFVSLVALLPLSLVLSEYAF